MLNKPPPAVSAELFSKTQLLKVGVLSELLYMPPPRSSGKAPAAKPSLIRRFSKRVSLDSPLLEIKTRCDPPPLMVVVGLPSASVSPRMITAFPKVSICDPSEYVPDPNKIRSPSAAALIAALMDVKSHPLEHTVNTSPVPPQSSHDSAMQFWPASVQG